LQPAAPLALGLLSAQVCIGRAGLHCARGGLWDAPELIAGPKRGRWCRLRQAGRRCAEAMGNTARGGVSSMSMCSCHPDSCVNDPRAEHVIVNTSANGDAAHGSRFQPPRMAPRSAESDPVTARDDGGLCVGDTRGSAGTIRYRNGDVYTGEWRGSRAMGYGRVVRPDSSTFEGQWVDDAAHGEGAETFGDGSWYRGGYCQGVKSGFGMFHWVGGPQFCGQFEDNVFHGEGSYYWGDGRVYTGQWQKNEFNGHGRMTWPDGQAYEGQYVRGRKDGEGTFVWANGRRFTGDWRDGKQHGVGVLYSEKGQQRVGEWDTGRRERWLEDQDKAGQPDGSSAPRSEQVEDSTL